MDTTPKTTKSKSAYYGTPNYQDTTSPSNDFCSTGKPRQQFSASLKARLKRSRRSFTSPISVAKRLQIEDDDDTDVRQDKQNISAGIEESQNADVRKNPSVSGEHSENRSRKGVCGSRPEPQHPTPADLPQLLVHLKAEVKERTETLRRLRMVKMYRSKNDLTQLRRLIDKWRSCCQSALYELQTDLPVDGRKASLAQLIDLFGLEDSILHFDRTEEDFKMPI